MTTICSSIKSEMNSIPRPHLTKIPGELPKSKSERFVQDLSKLTKFQLLEIKEREEKLLSNKSRISKLPDKGKRIQDFYEKVLKEINHRNEIEKAAELFSDLNITSKGKNKLNSMEWNGKYDPNEEETILDSDDEEETDPIKIIAGSMSEKKVKIVKPDKPLITDEDLKEIESFQAVENHTEKENIENIGELLNAEIIEVDFSDKLTAIKSKLEEKISEHLSSNNSHNSSTNSLNLEPHALYLMEKTVDSMPEKEKFKPYKTTKSNVHDPEKKKLRKPLAKNWEITAATPPPIQHSGTQMLPLQDSVEIQMQYMERLKELQEKQAEERLAAKSARKTELNRIIVPDENLLRLSNFFGNYRIVADDCIVEDEILSLDLEHEKTADKITSDDEVYDDADEKHGGIVTYPVFN